MNSNITCGYASEQIFPLNLSYLRNPTESLYQVCLRTFFPNDFTKTEKESLLEMGFQNPKNLSQTDKKTAKIALYYLKLFKSQDLNLIYDRGKREIIAYDSSFFDLEELRKKNLKNHRYSFFGTNFPEFHMQDQTFYGRLDAFDALDKLQIPTLPFNWTKQLKETPKTISGDFETIQLPSGTFCSQKEFIENPLFKYTLEKYNVFRFLTSFVKKCNFQADYDRFLENITKENWTSSYTSDPKSLASLSLIAFLEDRINQEDLFVIHMVTSALEESSDDEPVTFTVLQEENARAFLTEAQYPPFESINFYTDKTEKELAISCQKFLATLKEKSPVQKTAITYVSSKNSIEQSIYRVDKKAFGYKNTASSSHLTTPPIVLLPPLLCLELYQATSSLETPPPSDHTWMFGYNQGKKSLEALEKGRPISIASLLFKIPFVHEHKTGKQLGIMAHDILFHIPQDWQNPHTRLFIQLGKVLLNLPHQTKNTKIMGIKLLDRVALDYSKRSKPLSILHQRNENLQAFWEAIAGRVHRSFVHSDFHEPFIAILKDSLPSDFFDLRIISSSITKLESYTNAQKDIAFLKDLEENLRESLSQKFFTSRIQKPPSNLLVKKVDSAFWIVSK